MKDTGEDVIRPCQLSVSSVLLLTTNFLVFVRGTLYAFAGCGILFYGLWKLSGAKDLEDFRQRAGNFLPRVPKSNPPVGRTEFSGINDFLAYIIERDNEEKELNKKNTKWKLKKPSERKTLENSLEMEKASKKKLKRTRPEKEAVVEASKKAKIETEKTKVSEVESKKKSLKKSKKPKLETSGTMS